MNRWLYHSITLELNRKPQPCLIVFVLFIDLSVIRDPGEQGPSQERKMMRLLFVVSSGTGLLHSWLSLIWRLIVNFSITNKMIPADCNQRYQISNCPLINIQTLVSTWPPDCSICNLMKMIMWSRTRLNFKKYEDTFLQPEQYVPSQVFM